jgi:enoyl-CoA hydratase/carnithine racemase
MDYETMRFDVAEGLATVTLDRPNRLNAISLQMCDEMHAVVLRIHTE